MTGLLGPDGRPISSATLNKKAPAPSTGEKYGFWGGPSTAGVVLTLPGGGALQFDLDRLTTGDFRQMRDHYQINSSLTVLMFLMHQMQWRIICDEKKQADFYTEQLAGVWTPLVRSMSQAFWAGFSPNVLQWGNDVPNRRITLDKVKDLIPETADVKWKTVDGAGTNKLSVYDGIRQFMSSEIPVENSFWYPLLMENGNYYGRKLLRSAFQPWFFSMLLHLFANRYYERFGEPTPIGRAPYEDEIRYKGVDMRGNEAMEMILSQLRSRSVVVLPNDKTPYADETNPDFDYQIEYLESQMRGADFERYMTRLDEEMSLALFTPILLMRTADVGSYNLGTQHTIMYKWLLNAIAGDWKFYLDWYILRPLRDFNFGTNAPRPEIKFKKQGLENEDMIRDIVRAMIAKDQIKPQIDELAEIAGLELSEVQQLTAPADPTQPGDPTQPSQAPNGGSGSTGNAKETRERLVAVVGSLSERIAPQVDNAFRRNSLSEAQFSLGFQRQFRYALMHGGHNYADAATDGFYQAVNALLRDMVDMEFASTREFMDAFSNYALAMVDRVLKEI